MAIYTIDDNNIIAVHAQVSAGGIVGARFGSRRDLAKVTAKWPLARLVETWNRLPIGDLKPVKEFSDRKTAVARIWTAIQRLAPVPAPPGAASATRAAKPTNRTHPAGGAHRTRKGSKKASILAMLRSTEGATLKQIVEITGWQRHTVRGFISGAVGKQLGLKVESTRTEAGERRYRIPA
jgi:hypothetical protein